MQNKNTILWHFVGHFCGVLTRSFVAFWRTLLRCGRVGMTAGKIWLGEDYGGETERFEELLELGLA